MRDDGKTVGIWIGQQESLIDDFDEYFSRGETNYSRSLEIKEAMRFYLACQKALDETEFEFPNSHAERAWVRQAIIDAAQREFADE